MSLPEIKSILFKHVIIIESKTASKSFVANEGGVGVFAAAMIGVGEADITSNYREANIRALKQEIRKAREKTNGILGVNIMVALTNFSIWSGSLSMKAWMLFLLAQACLFVCRLYLPEGANTKLFPIISSACAANILCRNWLLLFQYLSDSFVLEGPKAGGHLGFKEQKLEEKSFSLEESLPKVLEPVSEFEKEAGKKIPVIAAGGIFDGQDIHRFLSMGGLRWFRWGPALWPQKNVMPIRRLRKPLFRSLKRILKSLKVL